MTKKEKTKDNEEVEKLKAEITDLTDTLKRVQADFQNYQQRVERDRGTHAKYAGESIIKKLLPALDNFELALKHAKQKDDFYKGIEMTYASVREILSDEGVQTIPAIGLPFDPLRHEALMTQESEQPKNTVVEEMQKGYTLHEKIIRPAKVAISKGKTKEE